MGGVQRRQSPEILLFDSSEAMGLVQDLLYLADADLQ